MRLTIALPTIHSYIIVDWVIYNNMVLSEGASEGKILIEVEWSNVSGMKKFGNL